MRRTLAGETLAKQKLTAFEQLQPEFEANFHFIQDVHGQLRFAIFPVTETVHYLHALWVCELKERLLSVRMNIGRYEGRQCLSLLQQWQEGETAAVVAFLQRKLGGFFLPVSWCWSFQRLGQFLRNTALGSCQHLLEVGGR